MHLIVIFLFSLKYAPLYLLIISYFKYSIFFKYLIFIYFLFFFSLIYVSIPV